MVEALYTYDQIIPDTWTHYFIIAMAVASIGWAVAHAVMVEKVEMHAENVQVNEEVDPNDPEQKDLPTTPEAALAEMVKINTYIKDGAITFLKKEYLYLTIFCFLFGIVLLCTVDVPWNTTVDDAHSKAPFTTIAFWVGAFTSMAAGYIGMMIATSANVKTTYGCNITQEEGFKHAFRGGQVLGFALVGLALLILEIIILSYRPAVLGKDSSYTIGDWTHHVRELFEYVSGYGLGGSTVALFGRVGGGIYTKAADVGADLAGKVGEKLPEDSPLNPGTIADNVGDNVGDIAGMGADLFGSLAESTCAALVVSCSAQQILLTNDAAYFPMVVTAVGIGASFITTFFAYINYGSVEFKLKMQLIISTLLMSAMLVAVLNVLPSTFTIQFAGTNYVCSQW
jgi:inorganic pyrophosphatase